MLAGAVLAMVLLASAVPVHKPVVIVCPSLVAAGSRLLALQEQAERSRKRPREAELPGEEPARADAIGDASEDEGLEAPATAEDAAFIDDEGAPPDERPQV